MTALHLLPSLPFLFVLPDKLVTREALPSLRKKERRAFLFLYIHIPISLRQPISHCRESVPTLIQLFKSHSLFSFFSHRATSVIG